MLEEQLLEGYKKYNYLNDKIKIFVSYIKPSFLFKTDILTPIHLGRAVAQDTSKDGKISEENLKWLYENCIGDDDFDGNISHENRRIGFLTGTYKAWKNYQQLGNPDYFGSFGYRRLLKPIYFEELGNVDFIAPAKKSFGKTLKEQFICAHGEELYNVMIETLKLNFPEDLELFNQYFENKSGYFFEIYILKKELFFPFCEWIFKILFSLLETHKERIAVNATIKFDDLLIDFLQTDEKTLTEKVVPKAKGAELRDIAFIFERLTGFYLYKLMQNPALKYLEVPVAEIEPPPFFAMKDVILAKMREKACANKGVN